MYKKTIIILPVVLFFIFITPFASAQLINPMINPAAEHCEKLGYEYITKDTAEGQIGVCQVSQFVQVPAWDFIKGKAGQEYNLCSQKGYKTITVVDSDKCRNSGTMECALCVKENGEEQALVEIIVEEREEILVDPVCDSNGQCTGEETAMNCPDDCLVKKAKPADKKSGQQGVGPESLACGDGKCLAPETEQNCPQDCVKKLIDEAGNTNNLTAAIISIILVMLLAAVIIFIVFKIGKHKEEQMGGDNFTDRE